MATVLKASETPFGADASDRASLAGEIVSWDLAAPSGRRVGGGAGGGGFRTTLTHMRESLKSVGLDSEEARESETRDAFKRAVNRMKGSGIVRTVPNGDDPNIIKVQFTDEFLEKGMLQYKCNAILTMDLKEGTLQCANEDTQRLAETTIKEMMEYRTGTDVVRVANRIIMKADIDLFPIRARGGAYFVAADGLDVVDKIDRFFRLEGGHMNRWAISKSAPGSSASLTVAETIKEAIDDQVKDLNKLVMELEADSRPSSFERVAEKIKAKRLKAESYACLLDSLKDEVLENIEACDEKLTRVIENILAGRDRHEGIEEEESDTDEDASMDDGDGEA